VSTCDAILFMLSSSVSIDLYQTFFRRAATDRDVLFAGRIAAILGASVGVLLAIVLPSIISSLQIFYPLMAVALSATLIVGLYSRRPTAAPAIVAKLTSAAITGCRRAAPQ